MKYPAECYGVSTGVIPESCLPVGRTVNRESGNHEAHFISGYPLERYDEYLMPRGFIPKKNKTIMSLSKKIGIVLLLIGICLPTATLPFITEFKPVPELCLTSNFFQNMGNMIVVFGSGYMSSVSDVSGLLAIPYRYLFSSGVILACIGCGAIVLSGGSPSLKKD